MRSGSIRRSQIKKREPLSVFIPTMSQTKGETIHFLAACEVTSLDESGSRLAHRVIPAGNYARFTVTWKCDNSGGGLLERDLEIEASQILCG